MVHTRLISFFVCLFLRSARGDGAFGKGRSLVAPLWEFGATRSDSHISQKAPLPSSLLPHLGSVWRAPCEHERQKQWFREPQWVGRNPFLVEYENMDTACVQGYSDYQGRCSPQQLGSFVCVQRWLFWLIVYQSKAFPHIYFLKGQWESELRALCRAGAAHVYLQHQVPVAGLVLFSNWVGRLFLNRRENENNWHKNLFQNNNQGGKDVHRRGGIITDEEASNLRERSSQIWKMPGKSCLFPSSVSPHLWVRNAVIWGVAPYYKKVKHQADLIKSSLQETISISMPSFMQIH